MPGKIILSGEHSIFQTGVALTAAINIQSKARFKIVSRCPNCTHSCCKISLVLEKKAYCFAIEHSKALFTHICHLSEQRKKDIVDAARINDDTVNGAAISGQPKPPDEFLQMVLGIEQILNICLQHSNILDKVFFDCIVVEVESKIPQGSGLGSSAVFSLLMAGGFLQMADNRSVDANDVAFECEKIFHSSPSGIDNTTIARGGLCWFHQLKLTERIDHDNELMFLVVNTGIVKNTKVILAKLEERWNGRMEDKQQILDEIGIIGMEMKDSHKAFDKFQILIDENQQLLQKYGVSCDKIEEILSLGAQFGLKGKISGAGCGGCVFFPFKRGMNVDSFKAKLTYEYQECCIDNEGIKIKESE